MDLEEQTSGGAVLGTIPASQYCSTCSHYSLPRDWTMRGAGTDEAQEQCPCCGAWRDPAGVWTFPGLYAAHSFGPLETDGERNAAAEERRLVLPPVSTSPVLAGDGRYSSPQTRGRWVLALLGVTIAADLFSVLALGAQRAVLNRGRGNIGLSEWQTSVHRVQDLSAVELLLYIATAIAFFVWLHRCYINLPALSGRRPRFTPGWAVGYWFIPLLNIVRSKQILDELWHSSAPAEGADAEKKPLTIVWLCALLVAGLTSRAAAATGNATFGDLKSVNELLLASSLADVCAAILLFRLVRAVTAWQQRA